MRTQHNTATARRWSLFLAVPALAALALTFALARPAPASASGVSQNTHIDLNIIKQVPLCTGGAVLLTGVDHFVFEITLDNAGGFLGVDHQHAQLTGTDSQGNTYIGNLSDDSTFTANAGVEQTRAFTLVAVSKGAAQNVAVHFTQHFTVNADGTVTTSVDQVNATCQS